MSPTHPPRNSCPKPTSLSLAGFLRLAEQWLSSPSGIWQDRVMQTPRASVFPRAPTEHEWPQLLRAKVPKPCCRHTVGCELAPALVSWAVHPHCSSSSDFSRDSPQVGSSKFGEKQHPGQLTFQSLLIESTLFAAVGLSHHHIPGLKCNYFKHRVAFTQATVYVPKSALRGNCLLNQLFDVPSTLHVTLAGKISLVICAWRMTQRLWSGVLDPVACPQWSCLVVLAGPAMQSSSTVGVESSACSSCLSFSNSDELTQHDPPGWSSCMENTSLVHQHIQSQCITQGTGTQVIFWPKPSCRSTLQVVWEDGWVFRKAERRGLTLLDQMVLLTDSWVSTPKKPYTPMTNFFKF